MLIVGWTEPVLTVEALGVVIGVLPVVSSPWLASIMKPIAAQGITDGTATRIPFTSPVPKEPLEWPMDTPMDKKDARSGECSKIPPLSQLRSARISGRCIMNKAVVRYKGQKQC